MLVSVNTLKKMTEPYCTCSVTAWFTVWAILHFIKIAFETNVGLEQSRVRPTAKFSLQSYNHILLKQDPGNFEMVLYISTGHYIVNAHQ